MIWPGKPLNRRRRRALLAALVHSALVVAPATPASADPATTSSATATGVQATGLLAVPPTPTITAGQPPDSGELRRAVLELPVPPLALSASLVVVAEASRESRIGTPVFPELQSNALRRHVAEAETNARAFARAQGLALVLDPSPALPLDLLTQTLVSATAVETVAVARCVDGRALFDTDFNVAGLKLLGQDAGLDALLLPLLSALNLPGAISVVQGEAGRLPSGDGIFINGLHVSIPALNVDLVVARSEARMPTPCQVAESQVEASQVEPTQAEASQVEVAAELTPVLAASAEAPQLAASGGSVPLVVPVGMVLAGLALARLRRAARPRPAPVPVRARRRRN